MAAGDKFQGTPTCKTIETSDATVSELMVYTLQADHTVLVRVEVVAQRYDSGENDEVYSYTNDHIFNKDGALDAVLRDSGTAEELDPQTTGWAITVDANNDDARVQVTGTAAEDVRWMGRITVLDIEQEVAP